MSYTSPLIRLTNNTSQGSNCSSCSAVPKEDPYGIDQAQGLLSNQENCPTNSNLSSFKIANITAKEPENEDYKKLVHKAIEDNPNGNIGIVQAAAIKLFLESEIMKSELEKFQESLNNDPVVTPLNAINNKFTETKNIKNKEIEKFKNSLNNYSNTLTTSQAAAINRPYTELENKDTVRKKLIDLINNYSNTQIPKKHEEVIKQAIKNSIELEKDLQEIAVKLFKDSKLNEFNEKFTQYYHKEIPQTYLKTAGRVRQQNVSVIKPGSFA